MDRAYATLTVKAVNEDQRIITGVATTPTTDRVGDIVEPLGVRFRNPLPLLHQHNSTEPVGTVKFDKPTKGGITFEARLPQIDEPPSLKDRIDTAWAEIKAGLVRGVSIGFRSLEHSFMDDGGIRFLETEVLELSLVTIPANQDATIQTIKSIDAELRAASGQSPHVVIRPVATGKSVKSVRLKEPTMARKTIAEQVAGLEATRVAKAAKMEEIQSKAADDERTKDEAERDEFDALGDEIESIDKEIADLRRLEKAQVTAAKAVAGHNSQAGTESRGGQVVTMMKRNLPKGIGFARYVKCLVNARGVPASALAMAEHHYPDMDDLHLVLRAAVAAGTTTDADWAAPLVQYQDLANEFIEYLRPATIVGKFGTMGIPPLRSIPFNVRVPRQTSGGDAYWVGEGQPKPLTSFSFDSLTLRWAKIANIAVLTDEMVRFSNPAAEGLIRDQLRDALVARIDLTFVDPAITAIADTRPASITNGRTPVTASGTDAAAVRADVQELFGNFIANNLSPTNGVWIMNSTSALALSMMRNALDQSEFPSINMNGGTFFGLPVITSQHMAAAGSPATSNIILVDASEVFLADDGTVTIDASREASLQMLDDPTNASTSGSPAGPTPTTLVSMFQTNSVALRAERYINWARRRDTGVEYITGAAYAA